MPIATRLTNTGTLIVNGSFDENTSIAPAKFRTTANTVYAGTFDEFTGAPVVDTSLMVWLDAAQIASYSGSGATWTDLSGNGKTYTLSNSPTFNSITSGGVITFAGASSQYANATTTLFNSTTTNTYSVNIWVYPTGAGQIVSVDGQSTPNTAYHYTAMEITAAGLIYFGQWAPGMTTVATSSQSLNAWYNLVLTYNGTTATAYVNGVSVGSNTIGWNAPGASTFFAIMSQDATNMSGSTAYASGSVGAFSVYNRALTAAEVAQNYNALRSRYEKTAITATQMPVVQRQQNSGTLLVNSGGFDEFTGIASVVEGLVAYYDPAYSSSYSGAGANLYNLVDGVAATLNGTYSAGTAAVGTSVSGTQTIRLTNSDLVTATNNISHIQAPSFTNITTVSIWFYQHTYNGISRYILDGRTGGGEGWIYNGSIGSNWSTGIVYVNGGASSGTPSWNNWGGAETGVWKNVTFITSSGTPFTDDINIFSRFTDTEGLDVTFGPILIYNRVLTQAENLLNFNALRNRYGI